jgi:metallophosphoesterase (TIGR00282 family)
MRILFFGDIVGRPGREVMPAAVARLRAELSPDIVIANVENIAHGIGITPNTWQEVRRAGVDVGTAGNHTFRKPHAVAVYEDPEQPIVRPINLKDAPGSGVRLVNVGTQKLLIINAIGRVFAKEEYDDPFVAVDRALADYGAAADAIFVDFHAEATSEKRGFGYAYDGQVSAIVGTHTHVPTADSQLLPAGTAYITDVGMVGPYPSVIGVQIPATIKQFRGEEGGGVILDEEPPAVEIGAVLIETAGPRASTSITHHRFILET